MKSAAGISSRCRDLYPGLAEALNNRSPLDRLSISRRRLQPRRWGVIALACLLLSALPGAASAADAPTIRVGSKPFTEGYVLAELAALQLEAAGFRVERKLGLGGTLLIWEALRKGEIDLYPEYTGTLSQAILKLPDAAPGQIRAALAGEDLRILLPLGFNNSYALAARGPLARRENLSAVSQLAALPDARLGFSLEFLNREDGWRALSAHYQLPQQPVGLEHALAYGAMAAGQLDVTDAYTTDGELLSYDIEVLEDDRAFFPRYDAILLARASLPQDAAAALQPLRGRLDERAMQRLNAQAAAPGASPRQVAAEFLQLETAEPPLAAAVLNNTLMHLQLTAIALVLACLFALPLAVLLSQHGRAAGIALYAAGLLQTIPSLALLAIMVPFLGLGQAPAVLALFLYSLLPIIRNTLTGIGAVDPLLREMAAGMGLSVQERLLRVEIPLALPTILAGIKTAAIISIGTATLAAFVGAGGLGEPIITGLTLNDHRLILSGAVPAALLAIAAELLFGWMEKSIAPPHLRPALRAREAARMRGAV